MKIWKKSIKKRYKNDRNNVNIVIGDNEKEQTNIEHIQNMNENTQ